QSHGIDSRQRRNGLVFCYRQMGCVKCVTQSHRNRCETSRINPRRATMAGNEPAMITAKEAEAQIQNYDAVVIGTGFGGTIATIALSGHGKSVLVLERGTFWVTPETLGVPTAPGSPLVEWARGNNSGVQYWPRPDHALGLIDLLNNRYHEGNPFGLHNYRMFGDVHILTASG